MEDQDTNRLLGGLNTDVHPNMQPEHTVRYCRNFVPMTKDGNLMSVTNENGTVLMENIVFPTGFKLVGYSVLYTDIIVILAHDDGFSQVGIISETNVLNNYIPIAPIVGDTTKVSETSDALGFVIDHPIDLVSRKLIDGHRVIYGTDYYNDVFRIDLDNPPTTLNAKSVMKLFGEQSFPKIELKAIVEDSASSMKPGITQFITRYVTSSGGYTDFGLPCNPIPVTPKNRSVGVDKYSGGFFEDDIVNKNIIIELTDVDTQFNEIEIIAIHYEGSQSVFSATIAGKIPITSSTLSFTYVGPNTDNALALTREELRKIPVAYVKAKCIEQKDNTLFLSNLKARETYEEILQGIANAVEVSYKINEVPFNNRGSNNQTSSVGFVPVESPYITSSYSLAFSMSTAVDPISGIVLTSYMLEKTGAVAVGYIDFIFNTPTQIIADTDTIVITPPIATGLSPVTFTAKTTPTSQNEFAVNADPIIAITNLADKINASTDVTAFEASVTTTSSVAGNTARIYIYWKTIDVLANGTTIVPTTISTESPIVTQTLAGATTAIIQINPTDVQVNNASISLTFSSSYVITDDDKLFIVGEIKDSGLTKIYSTGIDNYLDIVARSSGSSDSFAAGFTDYINETYTHKFKTYRRGEVYSLGFSLLYNDGTHSTVFHIPGDAANSQLLGINSVDTWPQFDDTISANSTGRLGTYVSEEPYPVKQNYPGNLPGDDDSTKGYFHPTAPIVDHRRSVRHHYIPELKNEPHFVNRNDVEYVRLISLDFNFTIPIPDYIANDVKEVLFVRERRNTSENRSILAQGLVNRAIISADKFDNDGFVDGTKLFGGTNFVNVRDGYFVTEMPFFNNCEYLDYTTGARSKSGAHSNAGIAFPNFYHNYFDISHPTDASYENGWKLSTDIKTDQGFFYSPETVLLSGYKLDPQDLSSQVLAPVMKLTGTYRRANFDTDQWRYETNGIKGRDYLKYYMYCDYFGNYNNFIPTNFTYDYEIKKARYADRNKDRIEALDPIEPGLRTSTRWTQGGLELLLNAQAFPETTKPWKIINDPNIKNKSGNCLSGCNGITRSGYIQDMDQSTVATKGTLENYLYNIKKILRKQYGQVGSGEYVLIGRKNIDADFEDIYGGDTFITKFAFNTGNLINYFPYNREGDAAVNRPYDSSTHVERGYANIDGIKKGGDDSKNTPGQACGWDFRACSYYFVESDINTFYRHKPTTPTTFEFTGVTVDDKPKTMTDEKQDYFPNTTDISALLMNFFPILGDMTAYNTQYSYENNIKTFFTKSSSQILLTKFENRTIYSEKASSEDIVDTFRNFLQGNYYDLPAHTGPIWDTFVAYDTLFMHTPKSLWITFAEQAATLQGENISDVVLGTGSLFARPSQEVMTTKGGYGGTLSQFAGTHTMIGYIFPDVLQGKMFVIAHDKSPYLKDISEDGMISFFSNYLQDGIIKTNGVYDYSKVNSDNAYLIDNPFNDKGFCGGYDFSLKRYWLAKQGAYESISFSTILSKWFSFHSYAPNAIVSLDSRIFFIKTNITTDTSEVFEMNVGEKGVYFDATAEDSVMEIVSAKAVGSKSFENIVISSISTEDGVRVRDDNFDKIQVFNDKMNTGDYSLVFPSGYMATYAAGEKRIIYKNDEYRIAVPRDAVVDNFDDITDPTNLSQDSNLPNRSERIKGDYARFKFYYNNNKNYNFVIKLINIIFNQNIR